MKQFGTNAKMEWTLKLLKRARRIVATKVTPDGKPLWEWQIAFATDHDTETSIAVSVCRRLQMKNYLVEVDTSCVASTIHSYLTIGASYYKFIVYDEASMIDAGLMHQFLTETEGSSILFVGDDGQLLAVGTGSLSRTSSHPVASVPEARPHPRRAGDCRNQSRRDGQNRYEHRTSNVHESVREHREIPSRRPGHRPEERHLSRPDGAERIQLSNGEIGYCTEVTPNILVDFGGEKQVRISEKQITFDLAYAVTCHKMRSFGNPARHRVSRPELPGENGVYPRVVIHRDFPSETRLLPHRRPARDGGLLPQAGEHS
ncbi:MAG: AAA family ATPase [Planctomycetia bacterium]|nr:AAA family ATPase [Planctomycetia bacterium]